MKLEQVENKIDKWIKSPAFNSYVQKLVNAQEVQKRFSERFDTFTEDQKNDFIEKCMNKYYSDEYNKREDKIGVQPRRCLFTYLLEYADKNCESLSYRANDFVAVCYRLTQKYVIDLMVGQGSIVDIYEFEEKMKNKKK